MSRSTPAQRVTSLEAENAELRKRLEAMELKARIAKLEQANTVSHPPRAISEGASASALDSDSTATFAAAAPRSRNCYIECPQ